MERANADAAAAIAERLAAIVESSDDAILSKDADGVITSWNQGAERIYGYTAEEAIGRPISILIPPHRAGEEKRILARVLAGERISHYETERLTKDGRLLVLSLSVSPIVEPGGEAIVGASVIARDITARHRSHELAARLGDLTAALSKEITPERTIEALLEHVVAGLGADAGAVGLVERESVEVAIAGSVGYSEEGLAAWRRFPLEAEVPMAQAIRDNEPVWTLTSDELAERFPAVGTTARFAALAVLPLAVEGRPFGAVSLSFAEEREFDDEERAFLAAAVQQAAHSLDRARLYEASQTAAKRLSFLAEASELLSRTLDPEEGLRQLAELAVERVADWCAVDLVDERGAPRSVVVAHADPARVRLAEELRARYPVDPSSETGVANVIRRGTSELYAEIPDRMLVEAAQDAEHLRLMRELGLRSAMVVPLVARGRTIGALTLVAAESGRRFGPVDLDLAEDLARRAALAIDNSMLFHREHEAAVILQRSLLPESLPHVEGLSFAARYEPAAPGLEVGGDWYEVVRCADGSVGLTIGDVAGRGVRAASVMGRIRPALRGLVAEGHAPAEAVRRLDQLIKEGDRPEMTTVFHLRFDPRTGSAEYVRAGHPPALVRLADGRVEELFGAGAPPVGILERPDFPAHRAEIPPGSLLLLYTDGLIERRGDDLASALGRLKRALAEAPPEPIACLERLSRVYEAEQVPDDVAMLAMANLDE
jgi:PAS domain S-box-containing protein